MSVCLSVCLSVRDFVESWGAYAPKNWSVWTMKGPWRPFSIKGPLKFASQGPFWGPFWGPWRSRRVPWALIEFHNDQKSVPKWVEGLDNVQCRNGIHTSSKIIGSWTIYFRDPAGSMEGPRMVCDYLELGSCVLRDPWYVFCCLECNNIAITVILGAKAFLLEQALLEHLFHQTLLEQFFL